MPQALKTLCLIHFWGWKNSLFPLLALLDNKNWPPSMKVKKMENFENKSGLKGCKWSSLKAPGTENPLSYPLLRLKKFPFPIIGLLGPSGVIRNGRPVWKWKVGNIQWQNGIKGLQVVQFECSRHPLNQECQYSQIMKFDLRGGTEMRVVRGRE